MIRKLVVVAKYAAFTAIQVSLPLLPWRVFYGLAGALGHVNYYLNMTVRERVRGNLGLVYAATKSPREIDQIVREWFAQRAKSMLESLLLPRVASGDCDKWFIGSGLDKLSEAMARGKGLIFPSLHFGPVGPVGAWLSSRGIRMVNVSLADEDPQESRLAKKILAERYQKWQDAGLVHVQRGGFLRALIEALHEGHAVTLNFEAAPTGMMASCTFLGQPVLLHRGPIALAVKTGAPVMLLRGYRDKKNFIHVEVVGALDLVRTGDKETDIRVNMQKISDFWSAWINRYPAQWYMWKEFDQQIVPSPPASGPNPGAGAQRPSTPAPEPQPV